MPMKPLSKRINEIWDRLWFAKYDPLSASFFRIFLGALLIVYFIANYPNWERFFAADGIISLDVVDPARTQTDWVSIFYWTEGMVPIGVFWWIGLLASICFAIGFQTRASTITLFVLMVSMVHRNLTIVNGEDLTFRMVLFYSCFAPLNRTLSVDSWIKRRWAEKEGRVLPSLLPDIWPIRLMQINIALIYVISLPNKFVDDPSGWLWEGTAIYWAMTSNLWARWPWTEIFYGGFLSKVITYGTVVVEAAFPLLVWFNRTRLYAIAGIAGLHLGIPILLKNITFFTLAMVCSFWVFVPSSDIRNWGEKLRGKFSTTRSE